MRESHKRRKGREVEKGNSYARNVLYQFELREFRPSTFVGVINALEMPKARGPRCFRLVYVDSSWMVTLVPKVVVLVMVVVLKVVVLVLKFAVLVVPLEVVAFSSV